VILGFGMTKIGRHLDRTLDDLAHEAADAALADAGVAREAVDTVIFANSFAGLMQGQESVRGEVIFARDGYAGRAIYNVENACASGSSAVALGHRLLESRAAECVLIVGAEKLHAGDSERSLRALATATDVRTTSEADIAGGIFMKHYADKGRAYLDTYGGDVAHFAVAAARSSRNGALNPNAQFREAVSPAEVLASRTIIAPLTLFMCSPISDGAAALVLGRDGGPGTRIVASATVCGGDGRDPSVAAGRQAFAEAGIAAAELDVLEVHDAAVSGEMLALEALGVCARGDAGRWIAEGNSDREGAPAVNTSGGLIRRGHPIAATGVAQIVEVAQQLRGEAGARQVSGARLGACHNAGGVLGDEPAVAVVTVMEAA
jgi:acetyl-CoA acetyltransferase